MATISTTQDLVTQVKQGYVPSIYTNNTDPTGNPNALSMPPDQYKTIQDHIDASNLQTSERLYVVESRAAAALYTQNPKLSDRGPSCSIRLISSNGALGGGTVKDRLSNAGVSAKTIANLSQQGLGTGYNDFLLSGIDVGLSEKNQIMTTFGDNEVVYYFGKNPTIINLRGVLIDSLRNDWFGEFLRLYNSLFRGTLLAKHFELIEIILPNVTITGSILSLNYGQDASRDTDISFSMQFYAKTMVTNPIPFLYSNVAANISATPLFKTNTAVKYPDVNTTFNTATQSFSEPSWLTSLGSVANSTATSSNGLTTGIDNLLNNRNSPVVSVIANLSKIVQITTNDLTLITSSFTAPVNAVLRGVTNVATQATSIANILQLGAASLGSTLAMPGINLKTALRSLKSTAGTITHLPEDLATTFKRNFRGGSISQGAAVLGGTHTASNKAKAAAVSSGNIYSPQNSFII